jgi:sugar lactone lactonase YvrE
MVAVRGNLVSGEASSDLGPVIFEALRQEIGLLHHQFIGDSSLYVLMDEQSGKPQAQIYRWFQMDTATTTPTFITKWGEWGSGDGQFISPHSVVVDGAGDVYVTDIGNRRIQKFTSEGGFITKWGEQGTGDGQFEDPFDVAVDGASNVYVTDSAWENSRIQTFDSFGNFLAKWGGQGSGDGQFWTPRGIDIDEQGNVYVVEQSNHRIQKFDSNGNFLGKWGGQGSGDGQFEQPFGVAVDDAGNLYVSDTYNNRIQKFDSSGNFLAKWGTYGGDDGQFYSPVGVAIGREDNVYIADSGNNRIQKFDANGNFLTKWGSGGSGDGQFYGPTGIATDEQGKIYVADTQNHRIQKFAYRPSYKWEGFFPPVKNPPAFNEVNAGRAIPLKFSLGGDMGLEIFAEGFPASQHIDCESGAPLGAMEGTTPAEGSDLYYDPSTGQYTYTWKTEREWEGSCRQLTMRLTDGSEHIALFRFK